MKQAAALHDGNQRCLYTFFCSSPKDREFVVPQVPKKSVTVCNFVLCLVFFIARVWKLKAFFYWFLQIASPVTKSVTLFAITKRRFSGPAIGYFYLSQIYNK